MQHRENRPRAPRKHRDPAVQLRDELRKAEAKAKAAIAKWIPKMGRSFSSRELERWMRDLEATFLAVDTYLSKLPRVPLRRADGTGANLVRYNEQKRREKRNAERQARAENERIRAETMALAPVLDPSRVYWTDDDFRSQGLTREQVVPTNIRFRLSAESSPVEVVLQGSGQLEGRGLLGSDAGVNHRLTDSEQSEEHQ